MRTHFILVFILSGLMLNTMAQEKSSCAEKAKNNFKVTVRNMEDIHMIYYEFTGPYMNSFNDFGKLMEYVQANNIPVGQNTLGVYYDDPEQVPEDQLRSEIGYVLTDKAEATGDYKYKKIDACKALSVWYYSMEEIMPAYNAIGKYAEDNNVEIVGYSIEIYHGFDPEEMKAEILMPIKTK
jgi:effector-binding domain-containing protein